ncbi:MAG: alpha/beta hydrolase [Pyrinomonadaceae bacterium]|nr:alpha/beta hydrolase [Pyrinomonadaceae bacterium]
MLRSILPAFFLIFSWQTVSAQEFIPLWHKDKIPNSRGLKLEDKIENERIHQVGTPGMYAFFPSLQENKGAAVLICPGGGYAHLAYVISGTQLAKWFNSMGVSAFVLKYRLPNSPDLKERQIAPLQDAQRAVRIIRSNAEKWCVNPDKIGVMGTSAGGHLAANLGTSTEDAAKINDELDRFSFTPNLMILVSPVITMGEYAHAGSRNNLLGENPSKQLIEKYSLENQVTLTTPPAFVVHAVNDKTVNVRNSMLFCEALLDKKVTVSLHIFPHGAHSIALRNNSGSTETWTSLCEMWLVETGFIPQVRK